MAGRLLPAGSVGKQGIPYALTVSVVLALGLPTVILPFWPDQAVFSTVGRTIADGGFPYVDARDQKPPSIHLIYALAIHGPFGIMRNVRVFDLAWTAATVVLLIELGRRWWNLRAAVIAGLIYGAVYATSSTWWQLAQPDSFIGLPLVLALLLYDVARGRPGLLIAAGVLLGFAFQLRFIMALLVPFFSAGGTHRSTAGPPAALGALAVLARSRVHCVPDGPGAVPHCRWCTG